MTTVFGRIIEGELPAEKVFEIERILVIKDQHPVAPIHLLIMPKKEISTFHSVKGEDFALVTEMMQVAQKVAEELGIEDGYRLVINNGKEGGQLIFHLHMHLISGKQLSHQLA